MKKIKAILAILTMFLLTGNVLDVAAKEKVNIYLFYGDGCPYCEQAEEFLTQKIDAKYQDKFNLVKYEVWNDQENQTLMNEVAKKLGDEVNGVPYIIIGEESLNGYSSEYNEQIQTLIDKAYEGQIDALTGIESKGNPQAAAGVNIGAKSKSNNIVIYASLFIIIIGVAGLIYFAKKSVTE